MTRVMIALDGTDLDQRLAAAAYRLFGDDGDYWAVNVRGFGEAVDPDLVTAAIPVGYGAAYPYRLPELYEFSRDSERGRALIDEARRDAATSAASAGLGDAEAIGELGEPDAAIRRSAEEHDVDVIVVGNHDRSWWSRLLRPSVSAHLVADSEIPVLVVRAPS